MQQPPPPPPPPSPPPIRLGPFAVAPDGGLALRDAGRRPALRFAWRGRPCEAALEGDMLRISVLAARVPSTAEAGADRAGAFAALAALPRRLPPGWRLALLPDHRVRLEVEVPRPAPPTVTALIARMVGFALALDPYLEGLESACGTASGMAKTWPG
jgi:hypothetical protein